MNLKLVVTYKWVPDETKPVRFGHGGSFVLKENQKLMYEDAEGNWQPVQIERQEIPPYPKLYKADVTFNLNRTTPLL